jgi:hypothetical protein
MTKRTLLALLGIWIAIIPSLGLPNTWKHWVIVISGLAITVIALKKKYIIVNEVQESIEQESVKKEVEVTVENTENSENK